MRKIFTFLAVMCLACHVFAQAEEPVVIDAPDTVINKTAYTLEEEGITIAVSYGSAYPAEHAWNNLGETYFAVLAGGSMTITATDSIKGIAINGWVKKNFSASCDNGIINYLSDDYEDTTGEPVLTISDIDNYSVTISCVNQLRCFSVEVYFEENPGDVMGEVADTVSLTIVSAEALDYSNDTTFSTEGAYSYWLSLTSDGGYPVVWLDMYAAQQGDLSGEYSLYNFNVGDYSYIQLSADELDYEYAYDQEFTITKTQAGYHTEGWIIAENDVLYAFTYDGAVTIAGAEDALDNQPATTTRTRKLLRDGILYLEHDGHTYTATGVRL